MAYRVEISPSALDNIRYCYEYIAENSQTAANTWFTELLEAIESLEQMPLRCPLAPESNVLGIEVRHYIYKQHYRILYTVRDRTVRIHHVRHSAREWIKSKDFIL